MAALAPTTSMNPLSKFIFEKINDFDKALQCPGCFTLVKFIKQSNLDITLCNGNGRVQRRSIVKVVHKTCVDKSRPKIYVCLGCELRSVQIPSKVRCKNVAICNTAISPEVSSPPAAETSDADTNVDFSSGNDHFSPSVSDDNDRSGDNNLLEDEKKIEDHFEDTTWFPKASGKFHWREHKKEGDGVRGLIVNSLVDANTQSDFAEKLSDDQIWYHLHLTSVFHNLQHSQIHDVTSITSEIVSQEVKERESLVETLRQSFTDACRTVLADMVPADGKDMDKVLSDMNSVIDGKLEDAQKRCMRERPVNHPTDYNTVRKKYKEGANSILQNLPVPEVKEMGEGFAYIPVKQIVAHMVAMDVDVLAFEKDSDWKNEMGEYKGNFYRDVHNKVKEMKKQSKIPEGTRALLFRGWSDGFQPFHVKVNMEHCSLQVFTISMLAPRGVNSKKKNLTLPFALCFKKDDHSMILNQLMHEIMEMQNHHVIYSGKEKRLIDTVIFLQMIMNDYPERCANCLISQNGKFSKKWGYSCRFCASTTPSCRNCEAARFDRVAKETGSANGGNRDPKLRCERECSDCRDWFTQEDAPATNSEDLPLGGPEDEFEPNDPPHVKLSFHTLMKACEALGSHVADGKTITKKKAKDFLDRYAVQPKFAECLINRLLDKKEQDKDAIVRSLMPEFWKYCHKNGIDLGDFPPLPMHMCTLGAEDKLIDQSVKLFRRTLPKENSGWKALVVRLRHVQGLVSRLSINWCAAWQFTQAKENRIATGQWQSEHFIAFTRVSLAQFSPLEGLQQRLIKESVDHPDNNNTKRSNMFLAFQAVRVFWFCLMSHVFADDCYEVSSDIIDDYVKLFLSSCNRLHNSIVAYIDNNSEKSGAEGDNAEKGKGKRKHVTDETDEKKPAKKKKRAAAKSTKKAKKDLVSASESGGVKKGAAKKKKAKKDQEDIEGNDNKDAGKGKQPFFVTGSNFLSLLNLKSIVDEYGNTRELWEGDCEAYLQYIKDELVSFRHDDHFMVSVLRNLLRTSYLGYLNENNPLGQFKKYDRLMNVRVYSSSTSPSELLQDLGDNALLSGAIVEDRLYLCLHNRADNGRGISLHPIRFEDNVGYWRYNLWYAKTTPDADQEVIHTTREKLEDVCCDYFILVPAISQLTGDDSADGNKSKVFEQNPKYTVLCRSWKVRDDQGRIRLPTPRKELQSSFV